MNALLKSALAKVERLSDSEQEAIAGVILQELEAERAWDASFARSQDTLSRLAHQARAEVAEHGSLPFDPSDRPAK
ncbi:MAG TPA: hypothetical protein VGI95_11730 [Caulobacteraceae bacterium]